MALSSSRIKDSRGSWLFLAMAGSIMGCAGGLLDSIGILVVIFVEYFDETNTKIGWVGSLTSSLVCFSYPVAVALHHRFGFRAVAITSAIMISSSYLITPLAPTANYLFLTYCIPQGLGVGFMDCLSMTTLPEYFRKYVGLAMGIRLACVATASMIFNYLIPIFIESVGWKTMFQCFSSIGAAFVTYALIYRPTSSVTTDCEVVVKKESNVKEQVDECLPEEKQLTFTQDRGFQLIVIGCIPFLFSIAVPLIFMVQYAKSLGYPLSQSKWLVVVRALTSLIGRVTMGLFGDFASRRKLTTYIAGVDAILFGIASGACSFTQHLPLMILYMTVIGFIEGMFWLVVPLMMYELTGGKNADYAFSMMTFLTGAGFLTGPSSMGRVFDKTGDFRNVLYIVCVCSLVSGVIIALGIYLRSQQQSEQRSVQENTCLPKILRLKYSSMHCQDESTLDIERKPVAQYETTV